MKKEEFQKLKPGDLVRNQGSSTAYLVTGNYGDGGVTLVKTILAFNSDEWVKVPGGSSELGTAQE